MGCDAHDRVSFFQQSASSQADGRIQKLMIQEPTPTLLRPGHHWSWLRFQANHHFSSDALDVREDTSDSCLGSIHQPNPNCRPGWTNRRAHYFLGEAGRQGRSLGVGETQSSPGGLFAFDFYSNAGNLNAAAPVLIMILVQ